MIHLPVVHARGHRYRARFRFVRGFAWWRVTDHFPQGDVHRIRAGWLLVTVMVDSPAPRALTPAPRRR